MTDTTSHDICHTSCDVTESDCRDSSGRTVDTACDHPGLDTSGACIECGERCSLAAEQDGVCMDTECPIHGAGDQETDDTTPHAI